MTDDPQRRFEEKVDPRIDSPGREGLTGTARGDVYEPAVDAENVTRAPDDRPMREQPSWRSTDRWSA